MWFGDCLGVPYLAGVKIENLLLIPAELGYCKHDYCASLFLAIFAIMYEKGPSSVVAFEAPLRRQYLL